MNYFLHQLSLIVYSQIKVVLPRKYWDRIIIIENNEPMVEYEGFLLRKKVSEKFEKVKKNLPTGYFLKILSKIIRNMVGKYYVVQSFHQNNHCTEGNRIL